MWRECSTAATYKQRAPAFQSAGALLPPGPPQQEAQQIQHKHGGLGERAEEGFVVLLPLEDVLQEEEPQCGDVRSSHRWSGKLAHVTVQLHYVSSLLLLFSFCTSGLSSPSQEQ